MDFLFVYGTLKSGFGNNTLLKNGFFVSQAKTYPRFRLYECGSFPALVKEESGVSIEGELWNIKKHNFLEIDEFEGVEIGLYRREQIWLMQPRVFAHVYLFCRAVSNLLDCGTNWRLTNGFPTT